MNKEEIPLVKKGIQSWLDILRDRFCFLTLGQFDFETYYDLSKSYYTRTRQFDVDDYNVPVDPLCVKWVSPDDIIKMSKRPLPSWKNIMDSLGRVEDGDWDNRDSSPIYDGFEDRWEYDYRLIHGTNFEETIFFKSLRAHFEEDIVWNRTQLYQEIKKGISQNHPTYYDIESIDELEKRCKNIDLLYEKLAKKGYKTQRELRNQNFRRALSDEIQVDVSRNGEFLFVESRTRLAISKLLDINQVPVVILVRHKEWIEAQEQ